MRKDEAHGMDFSPELILLPGLPSCMRHGELCSVDGSLLKARLPAARLGEQVILGDGAGQAEVVAFGEDEVSLAPIGSLDGLRPGLPLRCTGDEFRVPFSREITGRVLDSRGRPMDGRGPLKVERWLSLSSRPPPPLERQSIQRGLPTGVRALDGLVSLAEGQRLGLFAGPGLGKSTLLGQLARSCAAERLVIALVGERGREVGDFLRRDLGAAGLERSVVLAATADASAADRARVVPMATRMAEAFRDEGQRVLLLVDSLTRHARALRELALGAGERPSRGSYPSSVLESLAVLVERAGCGQQGSISAIYTVLTEGDAMDDPLAEELRGLLDGHWVLSPELARRGCFPALDPLRSLSRLMDRVVSPDHARWAAELRRLFHAYWDRRDLIAAGAYELGSEPETDRALALWPRLLEFISQPKEQPVQWQEMEEALARLMEGV